MRDREKDEILLNPNYGLTPSIGPIPATQLLPWSLIIVVAYIATNFFLELGLITWLFVSVWGVSTWWILTGDNPASFINLFRPAPGKDWIGSDLQWRSPFSNQEQWLQSLKKLPTIKVPNQKGGNDNFMPFANYLDLVCFGRIDREGRSIPFYLLKGNGRWRCVFPFLIEGVHDQVSTEEVRAFVEQWREGIKEFPNEEKATFILGGYAKAHHRKNQLEKLSDQSNLPLMSVLSLDEAKNVQKLSDRGIRKVWDHVVFCTYTVSDEGESKAEDPIGQMLLFAQKKYQKLWQKIKGTQRTDMEVFFRDLIDNAYYDGFLKWETLLFNQVGLNSRVMSQSELWEWTFRRFNDYSIPLPSSVPQVLVLKEEYGQLTVEEEVNLEEHTVSVLLDGKLSEDSVPKHFSSPDRIFVRGKYCAILTMDRKPKGWSNSYHQLSWLWQVMSSPSVQDTEIVVDIGKANQGMIEGNLQRKAKQTVTRQARAGEKGLLEDVGASVEQEETLEAQRKLVKGNQVYVTAPVFLLYRNTSGALKQACNTLANSFGTAKVKRERSVAWGIWLESLPFNTRWLRNFTSPLSESRLYFDSDEVLGIIPCMKPKTLDMQGVELLGSGGKPVYVDLFHNQVERALITGKSGSGKSILAYRFVVDALQNDIPVVGMDIALGDSTFKTAIKLLGDEGAYYDVQKSSSNLMELPDLTNFDKEKREERIKTWKSFTRKTLVAIVMGQVQDPSLQQRCENLLTRILNLFLGDSRIKSRYKVAFQNGWQSEEWKRMPTLHDLIPFCSKGLLDLGEDELDLKALNQIKAQLIALLESPLGETIGLPSSFSPEPRMKFFALGSASGKYESYILSFAAYSACMRTVLSSPKSLFIGDELSVLFKRPGFSELVGELCAVGRKQGIGMLLLSQDPDAICNSAAGEQIQQNLGYRITGSITSSAVASFEKFFNYDRERILKNSTESYLPNPRELCSYWLVEKAGNFWDVRYYPSPMLLGTVANSSDEVAARCRVLANYPPTLKGQLRGLKEFSDAYVSVLKNGLGKEGYRAIAPDGFEPIFD